MLLRVFNWKRRTVISNVAVEGRKIYQSLNEDMNLVKSSDTFL